MLSIKNLHVAVNNKRIINGISLDVRSGETHALMGPNGSGKTTLAQTLMGHSDYIVEKGSAALFGKNILEMTPDERSLAGLFLSFQYPSEIPGVDIESFLRMIYNKRAKVPLSPITFRKLLKEKAEIIKINEAFLNRCLNEGFSGGEKKRMEILQMLVLEPKFAVLDETDSGLDIDALKTVAKGVNYLKKKTGLGILLITHYARILEHIIPDRVHIMRDGVLIKSGGKRLALELEKNGYAEIE